MEALDTIDLPDDRDDRDDELTSAPLRLTEEAVALMFASLSAVPTRVEVDDATEAVVARSLVAAGYLAPVGAEEGTDGFTLAGAVESVGLCLANAVRRVVVTITSPEGDEIVAAYFVADDNVILVERVRADGFRSYDLTTVDLLTGELTDNLGVGRSESATRSIGAEDAAIDLLISVVELDSDGAKIAELALAEGPEAGPFELTVDDAGDLVVSPIDLSEAVGRLVGLIVG